MSSWRRRHRRDPRGLAPPWGTGMRRGSRQTQRPASEPPGPTVAADDALTSCLGDNGTASLPWALSTATCSAQVRRPASRPSPLVPLVRSRPPRSHKDRRRDADKSARGQPRHAATSPAARSISAHLHWRKSVPHPVTEYEFLSIAKSYAQADDNGLTTSLSLLMYGPPGTGKSRLARYIAQELGLELYVARLDGLISSFLGSTSKNIRALFDFAAKTPCVLFLAWIFSAP